MKRVLAAILCVLSIAGLAACGGTSSTAKETPYKKPTTAQPSQPPKPKLSERGNIIKHIGDEAGESKTAGSSDVADWTVTNIVVDPKCTSPDAMPPANGHYVEFDVKAATTADYDVKEYGTLSIGIPDMWQYVQKDGTQWNGSPGGANANTCMAQTEQLPANIGQSIKASGKVVFDVPSTDGILVYSNGSNGWEYPLS